MQYNRQPDRRPMSAANKLAIFVIVLVIFGAGAASIFLNNRDSGGALLGNQPTPTPGIVPGIADVQNRTADAAATTDYPGAIWESGVPVGNYTQDARGASDVRWIVIHTTEGTASSALNRFKNPAEEVSAHYLIKRDGKS